MYYTDLNFSCTVWIFVSHALYWILISCTIRILISRVLYGSFFLMHSGRRFKLGPLRVRRSSREHGFEKNVRALFYIVYILVEPSFISFIS